MLSFLRKFLSPKIKEQIVEIKTEKVIEDDSLNEYSFDEILENWKRTDIKLNEGASTEIILSAQEQLNFIFPTDFIKFYKQFNGVKDLDWVSDMFSIWPLERILEEYNQSEDKNFIPFCDFMIDLYRIGYLKSSSTVFKQYDQISQIASTFEETIKLIDKNSELLY